MLFHVGSDSIVIVVGIAVKTAMPACVIHTDIISQQTCALCSCGTFLWHNQLAAGGCFQHLFCHTAIGDDAVFLQ